jgi:ferredoxin-thioredoxin reductase catalytic subunit
MKKTWRCFVCNDIHSGLKPPEVCPTCGVRNAYVEVSAAEARAVCPEPPDPFTKEDFRRAIEEFASKNEFRVNPDAERVETLLEGIFANEANHGLKFCPCRLRTKDPAEDLKIVCPCNFTVHETYRGRDRGECWCGLFVRR